MPVLLNRSEPNSDSEYSGAWSDSRTFGNKSLRNSRNLLTCNNAFLHDYSKRRDKRTRERERSLSARTDRAQAKLDSAQQTSQSLQSVQKAHLTNPDFLELRYGAPQPRFTLYFQAPESLASWSTLARHVLELLLADLLLQSRPTVPDRLALEQRELPPASCREGQQPIEPAFLGEPVR